MSDLIIIEDPSQYPIPDEGLHHGLCVDAISLGRVETPWGSKEKVSLMFELESTDENGKRFVVGKRFTKSLNEKASLRKFLEKWRGEKYSPKELHDGINLEHYVGMSATLFLVHNETDERTYANIESIIPFKDPTTGEVSYFALKPSGEYIRVIDRPEYKPAEEFSANGVTS